MIVRVVSREATVSFEFFPRNFSSEINLSKDNVRVSFFFVNDRSELEKNRFREELNRLRRIRSNIHSIRDIGKNVSS